MNEPSATEDLGRGGQLVGARPPTPLDSLREAVLDAAQELANGQAERQGAPKAPGPAPARAPGRGSITLERPRRAEFGDYSTNAALVLAPALGESPREVAVRLGEALRERLGVSLDRFEVAGPGFLNLFLSDSWLAGALGDALDAGERFGGGGATLVEKILVEFVSANPTGPMHVGHA